MNPTFTIDELCDDIEYLTAFAESLDPNSTVKANPVFLGRIEKFKNMVNNCPDLDNNPLGPSIKIMVEVLLQDIANRKIGS